MDKQKSPEIGRQHSWIGTLAVCVLPSLLLPSVFPSIRIFSSELALHIRWQKYWSFSISPSSEDSGLISFETSLISLLTKGLSRVFSNTTVQKHQLLHSAFFMVQLSHPYMTTGKIITMTIWTFVGKVVHLLFPAKKQSSSNFKAAVTIRSDFSAQEEEICHCFHHFPFYLP